MPWAERVTNIGRGLRLGVYADLSYRRDAGGISTSTPFVDWMAELGSHLDELVVFGRLDPTPGRSDFPLSLGENGRFVPLPFYETLTHLSSVRRAARDTLANWTKEIRQLDAVLVFGPHPLGDLLALRARLAGIPVVVGVREDLVEYATHRATGRFAPVAPLVARALEALHKTMARDGGAVVVGAEMARRYEGPRRRLLATGISLVRSDMVEVFGAEELAKDDWPGERLIVGIGRLDPEKNPFLYLELAEKLIDLGPWKIELAGTGCLQDSLEEAIAKRGLGSVVCLRGRLDRPALWGLLRRATVLVSTSLTEGQPQVFYEAAISGVPIIASEVGGVASALDHGLRGILVPPNSADAIASALVELERDVAKRRRMVTNARQWAAEDTMERQTRRVVEFISTLVRSDRSNLAGRHGRQAEPLTVADNELAKGLPAVSANRDARLLDVGSAGGTASVTALAELFGLAIALDLSRQELDEIATNHEGVLVPVQADASALPFPSKAFDKVTLHEVLEHVDEPANVLAECARCLRDGGEMSVSIPTAYTERLYWRLHPRYQVQSTHRRIFDYSEIIGLLEQAGLAIEETRTLYFAPMISWLVHSILRSPADHTGRVLRNQWIDGFVAKVVGGLRHVPLVGSGIRALSSRYGKSWWFSCVKVPSL